MHIKELNIAEFNAFSKTCPITSHYQNSNYALLMAENNFDYDLLGLVDELGVIKAACLILIKKINMTHKYGYSPKGFLIDYFDYDLLKIFTNKIKEYYSKKLIFIKINPEIAIGEINQYTKLTNYNQNIIIRDYLKDLGYTKLKDNLYFEALCPRFNAIINLKNYEFNKLSKNCKNKIRKAEKRGLIFEKAGREGLDIICSFNNDITKSYFYKNYYNVFSKNRACDIFLIKIDYKQYLINSKQLYDQELQKNNELANNLIANPTEDNIQEKMNSDKNLLSYKNDIEIATLGLKENKTTYIAGAFIIKYQNRINVVLSEYSHLYRNFNANYYLFYKLIEEYKKEFKFLDMNGVTGDFKDTNPYKGLNEFKFGFNPNIYEFIGEFDLIFNNKIYQTLNKKGILAKEFNQN